MSRHTLTAAALTAIALLLGGCGDDKAFTTGRPILKIKVDEYRIVPQSIVVLKPGRMKFVVTNTGRLTHNLAIQIPAAKPGAEPVLVDRTDTMQPGQTAAPIKIDLRPGTYRLVCTIANHDDLGQFGTLKVRG
jgi:uncharacterized cupredoxin-like copper-binding protein